MNNRDYEFLVAIHELIEMYLCQKNGIDGQQVTEFDKTYSGPFDEPGDDPQHPCHMEHTFATVIEKKLAHFMSVDWGQYERAINALTLETEDESNN